jgi:hypothetical protein
MWLETDGTQNADRSASMIIKDGVVTRDSVNLTRRDIPHDRRPHGSRVVSGGLWDAEKHLRSRSRSRRHPQLERHLSPLTPVPMLKKIKACVLDEGTEVGEHDISGNRYAGCHFMYNGLTDENGNAPDGNREDHR